MKRLAVCTVLLLSLPAAAEEAEEQVRMSLARYAELTAAAQRAASARATWAGTSLQVTLPGADGGDVVVALEAQLGVLGEDLAEIPLLPQDVVIEAVSFQGDSTRIASVRGMHTLLLAADERSGALSLSYRVPARSVAGGARYAVVPLPLAPSAALTLRGGGADVEVSPAADVRRNGGEVKARVGATSAVVVRWGGASDGHVVRRVDYRMSLDSSGDGVDVDATFEVHVKGRGAAVRLAPESVALMDVRDGNTPLAARVEDGWHHAQVTAGGRRNVRARFRLAIDRSHGQPQVELHPAGVSITRLEANIPGSRQVTVEPAVPVAVTTRGGGRAATTKAVAHLPPTDSFTVRWTESRAAPEQLVRINTETYQLVTLSEGVIRAKVVSRWEVIRGKVKQLALQLPDDVVLYRVTGEGIEDWRTFAAADGQPRQVRIQLGKELEGELRVELELETVAPRAEGSPVDVPLLRPLQSFRETGVVALFDGKKVGFAEATATGFSKAGEDALPVDVRKGLTSKVRQAFKHVGPPGRLASKVAAAEERETRFDAHVNTLYTVKEGSLLGSATALIEVKSGRRDAIHVSLPAGVSEPRITAPSLNKAEVDADFDAGEGRKAWEVRFTQALEGAISVDVEFEMLLPKELGRIEVPDLRVEGAEVEDGALGISAETGIEVQPDEVGELRRVAAQELPKAIRLRSEREVLVGFDYAHPPWKLALDVKRHKTVETLKGVARAAWLETSVLDNGHVITRATYQVDNEDLQYLRLALPDGAKVLSVAADGRAVKAVADDTGAIALSLPKGRSLLLEVAYETTRGRLGPLGRIALVAPHADLRVGRVQWLLRLPDGFSLHGVSTDLKPVEPYLFRAPERSSGKPASVLPEGDFESHLFTYAVHDPSEPALELAFVFVSGGAGSIDFLLLLAALVLLGCVVVRRTHGDPMRRKDWICLGVGVVLLLLKAGVWGLGFGEGLLTVVVLAGVSIVAWRRARREEEAA